MTKILKLFFDQLDKRRLRIFKKQVRKLVDTDNIFDVLKEEAA